MILIPEKSFDNSKGNLIKVPHYHGILMINKQRTSGFYAKCVLNRQTYMGFNNTIKDFYSGENMMFHPDLIYQKIRMGLRTFSTDVQKIEPNRRNINSVCSYMTKSLNDYNQNNFNFCNVLFFTGTSKTGYKNYKPSKQAD